MQTYQLREKHQLTKFTTNATTSGDDTFVLYRIDEDGTHADITPSDLSIDSAGNYKRVTLNMPDQDCYVLSLFNDEPLFLRVGAPKLKAFFYSDKLSGTTVKYKLSDFNGNELSSGDMTESKDSDSNANGIFYCEPDNTGDQILEVSQDNQLLIQPKALHIPYLIDSVNLKGVVVFQKDQWMLLSVPLKETTVYDGIIKPIEDKYNVKGSDIFEVFNAYPSAKDVSGHFLSYIPGVTSNSSKNNFKLFYDDIDELGNTIHEITGFWVKTKNYELDNKDELIELRWDSIKDN